MESIVNESAIDGRQYNDFRLANYREIVSMAVTHLSPASFREIPWSQNFCLWRHDIDLSINRSLKIARINSEAGLFSTFFVNIHSDMYNPHEKSQKEKLREIADLGHDIGIHFESSFYEVQNELELDKLLIRESEILADLSGVTPGAFSFHNPRVIDLTFEDEKYGGLVNAYSKRLKTEVAYCSDSNGYWRFRSLFDVVKQRNDPCLQVLTHPGWWQDEALPPRQRVFLSIYGRARAVMSVYDDTLRENGRTNLSGNQEILGHLKKRIVKEVGLWDYLWNDQQFETLFIDLWRMHETQIDRLCRAVFQKEWRVPVSEVNLFFGEQSASIDGARLFLQVFGVSVSTVLLLNETEYSEWRKARNQVVHGRLALKPEDLEYGCIYLVSVLDQLADWGEAQTIAFDGLSHTSGIGIGTVFADGIMTDALKAVTGDTEAFARDAKQQRQWKLLREFVATEWSNSQSDLASE